MTTKRSFPVFILIGFLLMVSPWAAQAGSQPETALAACAGINLADPSPNANCVAAMESSLDPSGVQVPLDGYTLSNYAYWKVDTSNGPANVYDAPNGGVVRQIEQGFNFVVVTDSTSVADWVQIEGGGWMQSKDVSVYQPSDYRGVVLLDKLEQPFAWIMFNLYTASLPGGQQDIDKGRLLLKYDRVNVFASVEIDSIKWYMVGPDQWVEQRWVAVAKPVARPEGVTGRWVAVDLYEQTLVAYEDDIPVFATIVSTGLPNFDTQEGVFTVWAKVSSDGMSGATGAPQAYALQSVPWVMYFDGGISLHGTYWHNGFGYRHSHGCVNLSISDARYIFDWTGQGTNLDADGKPITYVYVYSSGVYGQFGAAQG